MAAHVSNCMPILLENGQCTARMIKNGTNPDWHNLVTMFYFRYIHINQDGNKKRATANSQYIKGICVGNYTKNDGLLFYLPTSKKMVGSPD